MGKLLYYSSAVIITLLILSMLSSVVGCKVIRELRTKSDSQTAVNKVDSSGTQSSGSTDKSEEKYIREIHNYDTTMIRNYYHTNNIPIPSTIIYERGEKKQESTEFNIATFMKSYLDSLNTTKTETVEEKKTTVLSFWQILGIAIGGLILVVGVLYFLLRNSLLGQLNKLR